MGLSSKEVSSDHGHGWNKTMIPKPSSSSLLSSPSSSKPQQKQEQTEPLKCPRCGSSNTKFCYYNNYNKSQPRHYCKACKRHWTKGGTLRNVPVGGGRKNKRKASNAATKAAPKTTTMITQPQKQPRLSLPLGTLGGVDEKNLSEAFYQTLGRHPPCSMPEGSNCIFLTSTLSLPLPHNDHELNFPYSNLGSFEQSNPCSISSIQSPNLFNFTGDQETMMMNNLNTNLSENLHQIQQQNWSSMANNSSNLMSNWGWDEFEKFVSVDEDELTIPWDDDVDVDIKP